MRQIGFWSAVFLVAAGSGALAAGGEAGQATLEYRKPAGPAAVETVAYDWHDAKRDRRVPVKIYYPKTGNGPFPVIIFSHGLGGSREGYEYLGRHWASWGYVSVRSTPVSRIGAM